MHEKVDEQLSAGGKIKEHSFPAHPADTDYCVFAKELEDDELVLFHATPIRNLDPILREGFKIPDPTGQNGLPSVSFAKRSMMALNHAMNLRHSEPGEYCIIVVRYPTLTGVVVNTNDIHDFNLDPGPVIIGVCRIPSTYEHV